MSTLAQLLKQNRLERDLKLTDVSGALKIDNALVSKIERGDRFATKKQIEAFIEFYKLDKKAIITQWMSEKILEELKYEEYALDVLYAAEEKIKYGLETTDEVKFDAEVTALLQKIDALKAQYNVLKPLDGVQLQKMQEYFNINYTFESNRIEGNTLTLQETHLVINEGLTIGGKSMHEHLEAINHADAIDFIGDLVRKKEPFTERILKEIHYLVLKGIDRKNAGVYRTVSVMISGSKHKPPEAILIAKKMEEIFEFYEKNKTNLHPVLLAAAMHEKIVTVHPFVDGNGRTTRLVMNLILLMHGFTIANIKGDLSSRKEYYNALEIAQTRGITTSFDILVCRSLLDSLKEHIDLAK
ncbi:MAG: Fic family protein [Chitinophagales bacterium]